IAEYREAIRLKNDHAEAHCNLGHALAEQGRFAESLAALRRGHELGTKRPGWPYPSAGWVRQAPEEAALERKVPASLEREIQPRHNTDRWVLAGVCRARKLHAAAARLYAAAFTADSNLAGDLNAGYRYNAARAAALAGCGRGNDVDPLDEAERA